MLERRQQLGVVRAHLEEVGLGSLVPDLDARAVDLPLAVQRRLAIARALISAPSILFADEPTFGLDDEDATPIVEMLQREGERRAVLLVTHNQRLAKLAGGITVLLIGGKVHEVTPSTDFFETPRTEVGQHFVRTGGYSPPSEDAPRARPPSRPPPAAASGRSRFVGPRGFVWGDVFEWVLGSARPYPGGGEVPPGFSPFPEPGRCGVLRGASWMTRSRQRHPRARRFAAPHRDELFCGFRSCAL